MDTVAGAESSGNKYGTGVAYVRQARLADGSFWQADMDYVLHELQKNESGLWS